MSDLPVLVIASMSCWSTESVAPSARLRVRPVGPLGLDQAGEDAAILQGDEVFQVIRRHLAVRVEDVQEEFVGGPAPDPGEVGTDRVPPGAELVAGDALPVEDPPAPLGVGRELQGRFIAGDGVATRAGGVGAEQEPARRRMAGSGLSMSCARRASGSWPTGTVFASTASRSGPTHCDRPSRACKTSAWIAGR